VVHKNWEEFRQLLLRRRRERERSFSGCPDGKKDFSTHPGFTRNRCILHTGTSVVYSFMTRFYSHVILSGIMCDSRAGSNNTPIMHLH